MSETFYKSSDEAKKEKESRRVPFELMKPGQSVLRYFNEVEEGSLRAVVSNYNNKCEDYRFKVIKHVKNNCYEVACLPKFINNEVDEVSQIVPSSPQAKEIFNLETCKRTKYPFKDLPEGMSFVVPFSCGNEESLRVQCITFSKKYKTKFALLKHDEHAIYEIYHAPKIKPDFRKPSEEMKGRFE